MKMKLTNLIPLKETIEAPASNILSLLASPDMKKYMRMLVDQIEPAEYARIEKLYKGLYAELKKHE
jgi:hypothetical protein